MAINAKAHGVMQGIDNTGPLQSAFDAAVLTKETLEIDAGIYEVCGTLNMGAISVNAAPGTVILHKPFSDVDCLVVTGLDAGRTRINGLTIRGTEYGRDLVSVRKGDYVVCDSVTLETSKRDGFTVRPVPSYYWVENMLLMNVKVQSPGRDSFHFEVSQTVSNTFINQVTFINCESRSAVRHALALYNDSVDSAQKISNFRIINSGFAVAPGADAIVRLCGSLSAGTIENISIEDTAIEETSGQRTGAGIEITGHMSGLINVDNCIIFGTKDKIVGFDRFPHYRWRDVGSAAYVPLYSSHEGIYKKYRTDALVSGASADVHTLVAGEELEGTVFDRYNTSSNATWYAKFVTYGANVFVQHAVNVGISVLNGQLRVTNLHGTTVPFEILLRRNVKETSN